jgi:hypothetical protein
VSLLYFVSSIFYFHICFILFLHGHVFYNTYSSRPLVDIVNFSGFHHCLKDIPYTMVSVNPCISFDHTNLSQFDGFLKYELIEACQDYEALLSTPMVMSYTHYFGLSSRINNYINTNILSPSVLHADFIHGSHLVYYFLVNFLHQFYDSHARFYDIIEALLEESYLAKFPMTYHYHIFNRVYRVFNDLFFSIFSLFLLHVLLPICCDKHVFSSLELHGWFLWHYYFT